MKNLIFIALLSMFSIQAQESEALSPDSHTIGDIITIGEPSGKTYKHILLPRLNFILKKGGSSNLKSLQGLEVVITNKEVKKGKTIIRIKRKDGKQFLHSMHTISLHLEEAIKAKEIF